MLSNRITTLRASFAATAGLVVLATLPSSAATRPAPIRWGQNVTAYTGDFGEPSIATGEFGRVYVTTPGSGGAVYGASFDGGHTWTPRKVIVPTMGPTAPVASKTSGSDSEVQVAANGDVILGDLTIDGFEISRSFDHGRTFTQQTFVPVGSADREWIAVSGATGEHINVAYHELSTGTMAVTSSSDGGKTFLPPVPIYSQPTTIAQSAHNGTSIGQIVAYGQGNLAVTYGTTRLDTTDTTYGSPPISSIQISVSHDYGLTWADHTVNPGAADANYGNFWMAAGVDRAGNLYATYSGYAHKGEHQHVWLQASRDGGSTWTSPMAIDNGPGNSLFGWVAGGGPGVAVLAWYHTDNADKDANEADWYVDTATVRGLADGHPQITRSRASDHVVHHGGICTLGVFCGVLPGSSSDRSLLDFFKVTTDSHGHAYVAFSDNADGAGHVTVVRQVGGALLDR